MKQSQCQVIGQTLLLLLLQLVVSTHSRMSMGQDFDHHQFNSDTAVSSSVVDNGHQAVIEEMTEAIQDMKDQLSRLTRQTMLQQYASEEFLSTNGQSGVHVMRGGAVGLKNYERNSHTGSAANSIHDHANYNSTLGLGELAVIMNGVYFRTRHNDYKLRMSSRTSQDYDATDSIVPPGVPSEVLEKGTVQDQILEMREWFKAFTLQNSTHRPYKEYFKPNLCYMEGAWVITGSDVTKLFPSERHFVNAKSWEQLQTKNHFSVISGVQDGKENLAYLPTKIMYINTTTGEPVYAQWTYRILCHPIERDIPLSSLLLVDDLQARFARRKTAEEISRTKAARYALYDHELPRRYQLLDYLFEEIPGKDNHNQGNATCSQMTFDGLDMFHVDITRKETLLNTCYYHRRYRFYKKGAMGLTRYNRGFNDPHMWVAQTHNERVAPITMDKCQRAQRKKDPMECETHTNRFTYAIPLEIVYTTPLLTWNPHNLQIHKERGAATVDDRNGVDKPFLGVDPSHWFLTPEQFYSDGAFETNPADTSNGVVLVEDSLGNTHRTRASGNYIFQRNIPGCGQIRTRYPIAPIHEEHNTIWKEVNALKDMLKWHAKQSLPDKVYYEMSSTDVPSYHSHGLTLSYTEYSLLMAGKQLNVTSDRSLGHTHQMTIRYNRRRYKKGVHYTMCGNQVACWDGHPTKIYLLSKMKKI